MNGIGAYAHMHPALFAATIACAIVFCMCLQQLAFQVAGAAGAALFMLTLRRRSAWKTISAMIPVLVLIALVNPLFNTEGQTVLLTYFDGRPYTLEALLAGLGTGLMFVSLIWWFAAFNAAMTTDRITYLIGGTLPSSSLVLTMIFRFVPWFQRQFEECSQARECIGKVTTSGAAGGAFASSAQKLAHASDVLSGMTTWAFEGAAATADSMESRGYGAAERTSYATYRFTRREAIVCILLATFAVATVVLYAMQGLTPDATLGAGSSGAFAAGGGLFPAGSVIATGAFAAYVAFLVTPSAVNVYEEAAWLYFQSKI